MNVCKRCGEEVQLNERVTRDGSHWRPGRCVEVLRGLIKQQRNSYCWCPMGIGNPMLKDHTDLCKRIQRLFPGRY